METYNPFEADIEDLEATHLSVLRDTPEGWYIEYKEDFTNSSVAAKSVSAFANTYGGWLFYGIKETADRTAGDFLGIDKENVPTIEQKIRSGIAELVSPTPFFSTKILYGPNPDIGLSENKAIITVHVPSGNNAPYVHSTGKIYRRVAESSEPKAETDRHFLDLLWQRGKKAREQFSEFIEEPLERSESEEDVTYIRIYMFLDPFLQKRPNSQISFEDFAKLMKDGTIESGGIPFDNVFSMNKGYVARQTVANVYNQTVFTWKYYHRGISEITLPVNTLQFDNSYELDSLLQGYDHKLDYIKICQDKGLKFGRLLDLSQLYLNLNSIMKRNRVLFKLADTDEPLYAKVMVDEVWRKIPFFDLAETNEFFKAYGLPVIQGKKFFFPSGTDPEHCYLLDTKDELSDGEPLAPDHRDYLHAYYLFLGIAQIFGVPPTYMFLGSESTNKLLAMGRRSVTATRARTDRQVK